MDNYKKYNLTLSRIKLQSKLIKYNRPLDHVVRQLKDILQKNNPISEEEENFHMMIDNDRLNRTLRGIYADWLEEHGKPAQAALYRMSLIQDPRYDSFSFVLKPSDNELERPDLDYHIGSLQFDKDAFIRYYKDDATDNKKYAHMTILAPSRHNPLYRHYFSLRGSLEDIAQLYYNLVNENFVQLDRNNTKNLLIYDWAKQVSGGKEPETDISSFDDLDYRRTPHMREYINKLRDNINFKNNEEDTNVNNINEIQEDNNEEDNPQRFSKKSKYHKQIMVRTCYLRRNKK